MTIESNSATERVRRFDEIEGLRAWLSWTVVGWHIVQYTALNTRFRVLGSSAGLAHVAVELFIIVSGFVIAHLVVTRAEPWPRYIVRRAFRLFPAYLVMACLGVATTALAARAVVAVPWAGDPGFAWRDTLLATHASGVAHFPVHALLHLLLLQGAVPDSVLPYSSAAFLGPAWSLSLEWQFYLVAPLVIGALARARWTAAMVALLVAGYAAVRLGWLGEYRLMSVFPAAALLFLTGIASRFAFLSAGRVIPSPAAAAIVGLALAAAAPSLVAVGVWLGFYAFLVTQDRAVAGPDRAVAALWRRLFGSRAARWFGARSYGVYVAHWPILQTVLFLLRDHFPASRLADALLLAALVVPATLVAAELLHRLVEQPMIRLGSALLASPPRAAPLAAAVGQPAR